MFVQIRFYFTLLGILCASSIYNAYDYTGTYVTGIISSSISLLYLIFFVKDARPSLSTNKSNKLNKSSIIKRYFIVPVKDFIKTISKKRPGNLQSLIWLQYLSFAMFWFSLNMTGGQEVVYLYLLTTFEGFNEEKFSYIRAFQMGMSTLSFFLIIPLMSNHFKFHDLTIQMICCVTEALSNFLLPLVYQEWQVYVINIIGIMFVCKWSLARSILSKSVQSDELGKALSGLAIVSAAMPFVTAPAIRELYKQTVDIFPGCFALLCGTAMLLAFEINGILYHKRDKITVEAK